MKLQQLIEDHIAFQQALGMDARANAYILRAFARRMGTNIDITKIRVKQVKAFLDGTGPLTRTWHVKISVLRTFYRYAMNRGHVASAPLPAVIPKLPPRFVPYIYSPEELRRLLHAADTEERPRSCLDSLTMRTILLLLYGTGLRLQEALNLNRADVDLANSLLTVQRTKFGKTRLVPFGPTLGPVLTNYAKRTRAPATTRFFTTRTEARVQPETFRNNFRYLCRRVGISRADGGRFQPRVHDLRHAFAVHRLTSWYRQGADLHELLPQLSVYLGHVKLAHTQAYLTMTPELLHEAAKRFEHYAKKEGQSHD